jgi:hypothetical protein
MSKCFASSLIGKYTPYQNKWIYITVLKMKDSVDEARNVCGGEVSK